MSTARQTPPGGTVARPSNGATSARSAAGLWRITALISATFVVVVSVAMAIGYQRAAAEDPLGARELASVREKLHATPGDEALKKQIREIDLRERQRYFARVQRNKSGAWLLLLGGALFAYSATRFYGTRVLLPSPRPLATPADIERETARARWALVSTTTVIVGALAIVGASNPVRLASQRQTSGAQETAAARPVTVISAEVLHANWPRFRGADGSGVTVHTNVPLKWDAATGENIVWKSPVPLPGHNSPVIWGKKLFLTGGEEAQRELFCFDTEKGGLLWRLPATLITAEAVNAMELPKLSGATSATVACDDAHVFAMFATGELLAADHEGHLVWSKNFGKLENGYGHATSLLVWRDRLILQLDQGSEEAAKSRLYAFDVATGNIVWQTKRALPSSWATPIVINAAGKDQIICIGEPSLISYDAADGKEIWRYQGLGDDLTPSPIFTAGLVIAVNPNQQVIAIKPDGHGDITKTHVAWTVTENVPDIASPTGVGELLFTIETGGNLVCREAASGKKIWEHAFEGEFQSSPAIAGNRVYVSNSEGHTYAVEAAREFKEVAHNQVGEAIRSSLAFTAGRIYIRGATNLFCISAKGGQP